MLGSNKQLHLVRQVSVIMIRTRHTHLDDKCIDYQTGSGIRQDLLGHQSGRIATHYSAAELEKLIEVAKKACDPQRQGTAITLLKPSQWVAKINPCKIPTIEKSTELALVG